jgi:predicted transcriptional regulator of viral defense system
VTTPADLVVARVAAGQWGVVTHGELLACGLSPKAIEIRVARGNLHPLYRGVYAVGHHNISTEGRFLAAVKACGFHAVLSHYSAASLHDLVTWDGRPFDITAPSKHSHPRIKAHRSDAIERIILKGIPVTPKLRTVIDLAQTTDEATVKRALRQAKFSARELEQLPRHILDLGAAPTRSPLEDQVHDLVVRAGLEPPLVNAPYRLPTRTVYPDLWWPAIRLIVEVDSREWHDDPLARYEDGKRQAELEAAGERVLRVTSGQMRQPRQVLDRLRAAGVQAK